MVGYGWVLMPCRALEAFGLQQTKTVNGLWNQSLNALSGIGGVRTQKEVGDGDGNRVRLNALSGIGGVRTDGIHCGHRAGGDIVLMPCRALEAFGLIRWSLQNCGGVLS